MNQPDRLLSGIKFFIAIAIMSFTYGVVIWSSGQEDSWVIYIIISLTLGLIFSLFGQRSMTSAVWVFGPLIVFLNFIGWLDSIHWMIQLNSTLTYMVFAGVLYLIREFRKGYSTSSEAATNSADQSKIVTPITRGEVRRLEEPTHAPSVPQPKKPLTHCKHCGVKLSEGKCVDGCGAPQLED